MKKRKALLIVPPCGDKPTTYPPYGALYIGTYLQDNDYEVLVVNNDLERQTDEELVKKIREFNPDIIGFSAIVSNSYKYVKKLSWTIRKNVPKAFMIIGGQLSYAANVVLEHTPIDVVVIGEGENTIVSLCEYLAGDIELKDVRGIAFKDKNGEKIYTEQVVQVSKIDDLSIPNYELIDMDKYLVTAVERFGGFNIEDPRFYEEHRKGKKAFTIMTGRGCQAKCTFCCRGVRGLRKHSPEFILDNMELLIKNYNVGFFTFGDESFVSSKKWVMSFIEKLNERKLDIMFYILGARVDIVDRELLTALKNAGCFMIEYGYETGSQRMLDLIEKRTTVAENYRTHMLTKELGLRTVPAFIINMPGETSETIGETIQFIKSLEMDDLLFIVKYAQAQPGTPLYEYALLNGMIKDEDEYLSNIYEIHPAHLADAFEKKVLFNFSGQPLEEVFAWETWLYDEVRKDIKKKRQKSLSKSSNTAHQYVKSGEYWFDVNEKKSFREIVKIFLEKKILRFSMFGKMISVTYFFPKFYKLNPFSTRISKDSIRDSNVKRLTLEKLSEKYLNNYESLKLLKTKDENLIKKLKIPLRRVAYSTLDGHGTPQERSNIEDSLANLPLFIEKVGNLNVKRYESLRLVCDDIREKTGKDVFSIDVGVLAQSNSAL